MKRMTGLFLIFLSGFIAGIVSHGVFMHWMMGRAHSENPDQRVDFITRDLARKLTLDPGQIEKVHGIIKASDGKMESLKNSFFPQVKEIMDSTFSLIENELNEDQKKKLQKIRKEVGPPPGGRPPPPPF